MSYKVWKTLFTKDFNCGDYIYHYTSLVNAIQIISSNVFLFSDLNEKNDFPEEKVSLDYHLTESNLDNNKKIESIIDFLSKRSKLIQLLCFCKDEHLNSQMINKLSSNIRDFETKKYYNVTGRGFANPLMWTKFNKENIGVCLVINKHHFEQNLNTDVNAYKAQPVKYLALNRCYTIEDVDSLSESISRTKKQQKPMINLMRNEKHYVEYNFFYKRNEWARENEYRYLAFKRKSEDQLSVGNIDRFLEGIVVNKRFDISKNKQFELSLNGVYPIQRIEFSNGQCYVIS